MEIFESNKLIALFMGGKTSEISRVVSGYQNIWLPEHGICRWDTIDIGKGKILCYHNSWDWLIPVVNRIYSLDEYVEYENNVIVHSKMLDMTYEQIVKFILWFNEKKNKK